MGDSNVLAASVWKLGKVVASRRSCRLLLKPGELRQLFRNNATVEIGTPVALARSQVPISFPQKPLRVGMSPKCVYTCCDGEPRS